MTDGRIKLDFTVSRRMKTLVPSSAVWDLLQDTGRIGDEFGPSSSVQLCGTISFMLDGEELLGPKYWIELFNLVHVTPLAGDEDVVISERISTGQADSGQVLFERRSDGDAQYSRVLNQQVLRTTPVPMQPLLDAWTYLWFRIRRLEAELGDGPAISATKSRDVFFPKGYFDQVDSSLIEFALEAPLEEVLVSPRSFG